MPTRKVVQEMRIHARALSDAIVRAYDVKPKRKPFRVRIAWGQSEEARKTPCDYEFDTEAELDAFLYGVDEAQGWLDYHIIRIVPKEKLEKAV